MTTLPVHHDKLERMPVHSLRSYLAVALAQCVLFSVISVAQSHAPADKARLDDLRARAGRGDAAAQLELGRACQGGVLVAQNPAEALHWFLEAAKQNNSDALLELGMGYEYGFFGARDADKAVQYYSQAAQLGNTSARVNLTHLYVEGAEGLPPNFAEAARWANCPRPSSTAMQTCKSVSRDQLPRPALELLRRLKCDSGDSDDYGTEVHLRADSDSPHYQVCCHEAPHGPCAAVLIGEIAGKWTNLTNQFGLLGFDMTCGGMMVLENTHEGLHDLCLPTQCSTPERARCQPTVLEFNGTRYSSTSETPAGKPAASK
jgi:hypothetical protein